jgi:hypothetical protein
MVSIIRTKCNHLPVVSRSDEKVVVYFDSSWSRKTALNDNVQLLSLLEENGLSCVYYIAEEFCEEVRFINYDTSMSCDEHEMTV